MPAELMLVNPRRRKRRAGPRKMSALQRKYFGKGRKRATAAPKRRRRRAAAATTTHRRTRRRTRRAAPAAVRRHTRRRSRGFGALLKSRSGGMSLNPRSILKGEIMPAVIGALGAVAADVIWAAIPSQIIPAGIKSGPLSPLAKAAVVIGSGFVVGKFASRKVGEAVVAGGLLVIGYDVVKGIIKQMAPGLQMAEYISSDMGYVSPAQFLPAPDISQHLGQYISGASSPTNSWSNADTDVVDHIS